MQPKWIFIDLHKTCDIIISVRRQCYGMMMQNVSTVLITQENGKTMSHTSSLCQRTVHKRVRSNLVSSIRSSAILPSMFVTGLLIPFTSIANLHLKIMIYRSVQKFTLITTINISTFQGPFQLQVAVVARPPFDLRKEHFVEQNQSSDVFKPI